MYTCQFCHNKVVLNLGSRQDMWLNIECQNKFVSIYVKQLSCIPVHLFKTNINQYSVQRIKLCVCIYIYPPITMVYDNINTYVIKNPNDLKN